MKHVGVREFRDKATTLLAGDERIVVERHGKPIGYYIPVVAESKSEARRKLADLQAVINQALLETGMTQNELADALTANWKS